MWRIRVARPRLALRALHLEKAHLRSWRGGREMSATYTEEWKSVSEEDWEVLGVES